ncbi:two component transcriptional regulator, winged helix family [candidate division TM7 genomosp. GTL1]|nr:two component transcriptional regulator, winged helix family [candidate division TM7 genomosp. GTL1]
MRILVVEDERKIALALKKGLEQEAFAVDVVHDGESGLSYAEDDSYDLIVLDRMLPGLDGLEICRQLRESGAKTPIIMLTAKDRIRDRVTGLDAGADDYLVKPFAFEELLARIRSLLRRPQDLLGEVLQIGDLTLNTITYEVKRGTTPVSLTQKEFALLEYLMRSQGRVVTKDMILNHVWDYDADILPNTIEVYIGYLRSKVERPFEGHPRLIHTQRGFGYKMETV